jgi:cell wall assembly regulator SMI1
MTSATPSSVLFAINCKEADMSPTLKQEVDRLLMIFDTRGKPIAPTPMAQPALIEEAEQRTGIRLSEDLKAFHRALGGQDYQDLFAVDVAGPMMLAFRSLPGALEGWDPGGPRSAPTYPHLELPPRDQRIQPDIVLHPKWFPLADFDGGSTTLYCDDAPSSAGRRGQVIVYQHDPDEIFYVADDFVGLLKRSNDLLEQNWDELFPEY